MNQRELFLRHVAQTSDTPFSGVDLDIVKASGVKLWDRNGKAYTDLISGISVSNIGHCHPSVVQAIREQSEKFMHLMVYGELNQQPQVDYAKLLCTKLPENLQCIYFTTGGSEATEGAIKLAKRVTGRFETVSFKHAYHGSTQGALSLMGDEFFKSGYRPLIPGNTVLDYNSHSALQHIGEQTAAVIIEPTQGEAGIRKGEKDFFKALRDRCNKTGCLLIFDEIQTGFGRTGSLFAFEQLEVVPDILLVAKGMGGGLPIGAFISSSRLMNAFTHNPVLGHINTFGGNAVCVRAAEAALKVILENNLPARARQIEKIIVSELTHPLIKDLRVHGALGAIDFEDETLNMRVIRSCIDHGLITDWFLFCSTAMRIAPPLVITDEELRAAITTIKKVLDGI